MDVDAVDAADGSVDFFDTDEVTDISDKPLWFGREVTLSTEKNLKLQHLAQFFFANLERAEQILQLEGWADRFHFLDFQEEIIEEITENFDQYADFAYATALYHPLNHEFTILDPKNYRADIVGCKNFLKSGLKALGLCPSPSVASKSAKAKRKAEKAAAKATKKSAEKVVDFVKEHPKEVLIGVAAITVGVGVYYFGSLALAGSAAAAGAGAVAEGGGNRRKDEDGPSPSTPIESCPPPPKDPMPLSTFLSEQEKAHLNKTNPLSGLSPNQNHPPSSPPLDKTYQFKNGVSSLDLLKQHDKPSSFNMPPPTSQEPSHLQSIISGFLETGGKVVKTLMPMPFLIHDAAMRTKELLIDSPRSCHFETEGVKYPNMRIGFINGMNTSFKEAQSHLEHIRKFTGEMSIEGVYDHSNTAIGDAAEIFMLSYPGVAPRTAGLLIENWTRFHEENINNPDAKYLQFAHSMGTILTKDALTQVPQEIRDRIIVVSIGPAVIIPQDLCYRSIPYASKKDIVHLGENLFACIASISVSNDDTQILGSYEKFTANKSRLTLLEQPPESEGMGHGFQDPVFTEVIENSIKTYLEGAREYQ